MRRAIFLAAMGLVLAPAARAADDSDVVLRALSDEMARTSERLRLPEGPKPYYVEYTVEETDAFETAAAFGALAGKGRARHRTLGVDVRVGDHDLDNTNFGGGGFDVMALFGIGGGGGGLVTVEDDYDALRHALWLRTDAAYKAAVEELEKKKAHLQANQVEDRPPDFSKEEPVVAVGETAKLVVDGDRWAALARKVSLLFRDYPAIQKSIVLFEAKATNRWFVNNEGFRNRAGKLEAGFAVMAAAQAADGMRVGDFEVFAGRTEKDLPSEADIEKAVRALAERLTRLAEAPEAEEYRGPVLLEGQAAAEFFGQVLAPNLTNPSEGVGSDNPFAAMMGNKLKEQIGQKIAAGFLSVVDDPTAKDFGGVPLLAAYEVDDDGVRAQKVPLIEKGVLRTFCASRVPSRKVKQSNGHSRGGSPAVSTLFVESEKKLAPDALRKRLIELGKEEGLTHVVVVRRVANLAAAALNPQALAGQMMGMFGGGGGVMLLPPVLAYEVNVEDGTERLVRGASFGPLTLRVLRDIDATGDDVRAQLVVRGAEEASHVVTPSLLVKEMAIQKPGKETEKLPVLGNPTFEK